MRRVLGRAAAAGALAVALGCAAAVAGDRLVVVELYTSQGCSSCPPADALFERLAARPDVLPLSLHVDYWDYIGWADTFADPAFTARQKAYARAAGSRTIYTPQMVVGGRDRVVGNEPMRLGELIEAHGALPERVAVRLVRSGEMVLVRAEPAPLDRQVVVYLVRFLPSQTVEIGTGENAGRTITYTNVVTDWREIGRWTGERALAIDAPAPGPAPAAVLLQEEGPGPIVAAAALR